MCQGGALLNCDDGSPCTADSCDPVAGCIHATLTGTCPDDGNPCTLDVCAGAECTHPSADGIGCASDGNSCTSDLCSASVCSHTPTNDGSLCNDGNACTSGDACQAGTCIGGASINCDDGLNCTTDTCSPTSGVCTHPVIVPCANPRYGDVSAQIIAPLCVQCHGSQLAYAAIVNVASGDTTYTKFVDPGKPNNSAIQMAIDPSLPLAWGGRMPQSNPAWMTAPLIQLMRTWITNGAIQ